MEETEMDMLKDHEAIDALLKERGRERVPDEVRKAMEAQDIKGSEKVTEVIYKIAFPLVSTALMTVVRTVIERVIGG